MARVRGRVGLVTTDHVLGEPWILIRHRLGRQVAERFWAAIRAGAVAVEPVGDGFLVYRFGSGRRKALDVIAERRR
jgi:hypothetical protein